MCVLHSHGTDGAFACALPAPLHAGSPSALCARTTSGPCTKVLTASARVVGPLSWRLGGKDRELSFPDMMVWEQPPLLDVLLRRDADGGTNFNGALAAGLSVMEKHWRTDQFPVIIFLSDGEDSFSDGVMYNLCRRSLAQGKALSFHSVSFGPDSEIARLQRMADIAQEVYNGAPRPALPNTTNTGRQCTCSKALDSVKLTDTFLGIAASLRKPRASLMRG